MFVASSAEEAVEAAPTVEVARAIAAPAHSINIVHFPSERRTARVPSNGAAHPAEASYFDQPEPAEEAPAEEYDEHELTPLVQRRRWPAAVATAIVSGAVVVGLLFWVIGGKSPGPATSETPATPPNPPVAVATPGAPRPAMPMPTPPPTAAAPVTPETVAPPPTEPPTPTPTGKPVAGASKLLPRKETPAPPVAPPPVPARDVSAEDVYGQALSAGEAKYRHGSIRGAIAEFRKAVAAKPDSDAALAALGSALYESGQTSAALPPLRHALALNPANARACLTLGTLYQTQGNMTDASTMYRRYLANAPHGEFAGDVRTILKTLH